jgi:type VI secretion system protein VasG
VKVDIKSLLGRLNDYSKHSLEAASGLCVNRSHYEVSIEHLLLQMLENPQTDVTLILRHFEIDPSSWIKYLQQELESFKDGNPGKPVFSSTLMRWLEDSWIVSSLDLGLAQIRSGSLLLSLVNNAVAFGISYLPDLDKLNSEEIKKQFNSVIEVSSEGSSGIGQSQSPSGSSYQAASGESAIKKFTTNFTEKARAGGIDPVFGRDKEIRQMVDILGRRRKNNPIAVGEPGVGKTAVVEGLALKVAEGDVPDIIKGVEIIGLDLGLLEAGASVKGEFEKRLNAVLTEIKASETPIILFIDEAHTLIGAGGSAGTNDAANLLKPALARGELRTIAATTWSEYKKYFEKDAALARRFQLVKLEEPTAEEAAVILRGLRGIYEKAHNVYVRDEAITTAAVLSARYISGRQLPDKAVDVLDTACARVKISLTTKPGNLDDLERKIKVLQREHDALARDVNSGRSKDQPRVEELLGLIEKHSAECTVLTEEWQTELAAVQEVIACRVAADEDDQNTNNTQAALAESISALETLQAGEALISYEVTSSVVGAVISDWTGIPLGSIVKDDAASLMSFNADLKKWIKGQDHAVDVVDAGIRTAKAGLQNPDQPLGIFLFVGPSGVGKTEAATGVANLMFGGDRFMVTLNMSEYQEKHTISRMVGSPAGYVGYGEGGILTEAVRQRPYSVVLLDEVEKADIEVMNLFYQVFDKGTLSDGEGRVIDFRNTIMFLTSNLASDVIMELCVGKDVLPSVEEVTEAIRPILQDHFKPALLARITVVPFYPLQGEVLNDIVKLKLNKVGKRLASSQKLEFSYTDDVVETIASRCTDVESGARNIDHIVNKSLLPKISTEILEQIGDADEYSRLVLTIDEGGQFEVELS